jgi:CNT family concentrative nucleoside transporter
MATVSSNVMAIYVYSLKAQFPSIAGHLISASILSAPAAILISKVILPEEEKPKTLGRTIQFHYEKEKNLFEAIINGANTGVKMIARIVALLIAVLGLVALFDMSLTALGSRVNLFLGIHFDWSLKSILGYIFYPFTVILGVPLSDAGVISKIIGERAVLTEVVAYQNLAIAMGKNLLHNPRSAVIAAYALCGFAHLASMAIFVGGVSALAPNKTRTLTQAAFPALLAATLACLLTACIAGAFITKGSILLG